MTRGPFRCVTVTQARSTAREIIMLRRARARERAASGGGCLGRLLVRLGLRRVPTVFEADAEGEDDDAFLDAFGEESDDEEEGEEEAGAGEGKGEEKEGDGDEKGEDEEDEEDEDPVAAEYKR